MSTGRASLSLHFLINSGNLSFDLLHLIVQILQCLISQFTRLARISVRIQHRIRLLAHFPFYLAVIKLDFNRSVIVFRVEKVLDSLVDIVNTF